MSKKYEIVNKAIGPKCKVFAEALLDVLEGNQYSLELEAAESDDPSIEEQLEAINELQQLALQIYMKMGIRVDAYGEEYLEEFEDAWKE
jgi:hypothetical protein